jgi:hypothetical protein
LNRLKNCDKSKNRYFKIFFSVLLLECILLDERDGIRHLQV